MILRYVPVYVLLLASVFGAQTAQSAGESDASGEELYHAYCSGCHGIEGDGFGVNSYDLDVAPRDHTDTDEMSARTDDDLIKAITEGGKAVNKSVLMPAWGENLDDDEIRLLVAHLRELCCTEAEQ